MVEEAGPAGAAGATVAVGREVEVTVAQGPLGAGVEVAVGVVVAGPVTPLVGATLAVGVGSPATVGAVPTVAGPVVAGPVVMVVASPCRKV